MAKPTKRASKQTPINPGAKQADNFETPAAFTQAPSSLTQFLENLSPEHVYLIHLDRQPKLEKHQIFFVPLVLNSVILALVIYRVYIGIFTYPDILIAILGGDSPARIDPKRSSWSLISSVLAQRTFTFLFDYLLIALFLPWPVRFITGPVRWRLKVGFQRVEIVVRKSRAWSETLRRTWIRDDDGAMKERIIPAITPMRLRKTGYLLIDADWDLDFPSMTRAYDDVKTGKLNFGDFETCVIVHGGGNKGWLIWRVEDHEFAHRSDPSMELTPSERGKIVAFKDKLTSMGKEDLFFRWVEIIQFESTQPGGFTAERQQKAMLETKELFEQHGVDFEQFWSEVGGMQGVSL
ncbi:uncharacterized protein CIMG_03670 [Coccidioides immitis RS]|uniref:Uncharacterized protein n=4 Tax=Coccidioides immitis TaxID=5501 RepID=J3KBW5_COCIM|nr:uncharacterized protein CIMG_03670 [Coccidioides immitis RS]KMP07893.1 hypothetical protein CIRG_07574 [Coccidioides immitis RMSCC 2394]KMU79744.1 hypothetical protein CISG_08024 [Coccidioides immitis RMSCC 3703]KMU85079.1 hypothetical protein CIHG_02861 [Coccidioides immitis H538.4]TPX19679.1 hypothetical protein DIZ76_017471 [Coccidioides immitis]EAS32646.3 hypothetical protein CIMG_03670 [Coccidioides immitis RS]